MLPLGAPTSSPDDLLLLTEEAFRERHFALLTGVGVRQPGPGGATARTHQIEAARLMLWPLFALDMTTGALVEVGAAPARDDPAPDVEPAAAAAVDDPMDSESGDSTGGTVHVVPTTTQLFVGQVPYMFAAQIVMLLSQITGCPILRYVPLPNQGRRAMGHEDPSSCILITVYFNDRDTFLQLHRRCIASPRGLYVLPPGAADFDVTERDRVIAAAHAALPPEGHRLPPDDRRLPPTRRALPKGIQPLTIEPRRRHRGQAQHAQREPPQSDAATQTPVAEPQPPDEAPQSDAPDPAAPHTTSQVTRRYRNNPY